MSDPQWVDVGAAADVTEDTPLSATVEGTAVGIYRLGDAIHALEDICPHADALLSQGFIDGEYVECPLHGALFHIPTGKCTKGPAERDVACYATQVEAGRIYIRKQP